MGWAEHLVRARVSNIIPQGGPWDEVDGPTLLAAASSLQLIPANVHFLTRLQRLAAAAARLPERPQARRLSSSTVKKLLADPFVSGADVRMQEDPYEGVYVTEIPYTGGPRLVLEGISDGGGARIASSLLAGVIRSGTDTFPAGYVVRVKALAACLLDLSHRVASNAGLERGLVSLHRDQSITVPSAQRLAELSAYVQFKTAQLWAGVPDHAREYLEDTLVETGTEIPGWREGDFIDEKIILKPLIRSGSTLTLASPGHLLACLRHHIIRESYEWGCSAALAEALRDVTAFEAGKLLQAIPDERMEFTTSGDGYLRSITTFDQDKTLDVICLVDDLTNYDPSAIFQIWRSPELSERIHDLFSASDTPPEKTLRIVAYQGLGRDLGFGIPATDIPTPTLFLSIDDLETILQSPGTDTMTLWYFALGRDRLEREVRVMAFSSVDVFSFYRDHDDSFYMSDEARPTMMNFEVGYGQQLRIDNYRRVDRHWVIDPAARVLSEAYAVHGRDSAPIHLVLGPSQASMIIENHERTVWVRLGRDDDGTATSTYDLGQAVSYWLWQLMTICPALLALDTGNTLREVDVTSLPPVTSPPSPEDESPWISAQLVEPGRLALTFGAPPSPGHDDPPNHLDRDLVRALLETLAPDEPDPKSVALLDQLAPPGPKQMIHVYGGGTSVVEYPGTLPEARRLQSASVAKVLDNLGEFLTDQQGHVPGPISKDQRSRFLNEQVTRWLMDQLHETVIGLSAQGLLEKLVTLDESLISETAREPALLRARLACFGAGDNQVKKLQDQQTKAVASSLASRFLIEYVTAIAPSGNQPLTNETYDHMLALASEIINKGMLSDAIRHNISDAEVSILGSGRLGISRDEDKYHRALTSFGEVRAQLTFEAAVADLQEAADEDLYPLPDADALAAIEFGFTFTDLAEACGHIISLGDDDGFRDVFTVNVADIKKELTEVAGWSNAKVGALLAALTLSRGAATAEEYWTAGSSVFPWRFSRDLSYVRRPLLQIGPKAAQIVAGRRRLWQTASFWLEQFTTGRLQGKTKPMKAALNKIRNAKGDSFELTVATALKAAGLTGVRSRLSRISQHDFRNIDGSDLGDIDAIGVDERNRLIYVIEAKDFEVARTPAELANEIDNLLVSDKAAVKRLALRAEWVRGHISPTLKELRIATQKGSWTVVPLVVVDERLLSARLSMSETPIISISELGNYVGAAKATRRRG